MIITSQEQTAGRGRLGRSWLSPRGRNLYFTLCEVQRLPSALSYVQAASLAGNDLLHSFGIESRIRWPNDLYVGDEKISGMLIEVVTQGATGPARISVQHGITWVIVGIGINVNITKEELKALERPATSMAICREISFSLSLVQERLSHILLRRLASAFHDPVACQEEWEKACSWMLQEKAPPPHDGIIEEIISDGRLKIRAPDGKTILVSML
jgi:BirA family transcriptional regulator, biotin operon repressor / biotin---[acetyl-CoA-carboxylase] ligase